jgi:hypothetical protein
MMTSSWPDLLRRIQATGARDEIQRLLELFLVLAERDGAGTEYVLEVFRRTMDEWEEEGGLCPPSPRGMLRLVTAPGPGEQGLDD